jgi:uncharacterized protein involved in exopolysaccharide biosynthesis
MTASLKLDDLEKASPLRTHQEDVAAKTLRSIARHKLLIASIVTIALVLAAYLIPQLPRRYSAEVLVHPDLFAREETAKLAPLASIDAASLVTSEARLIRSDAMLRAVVIKLGLDQARPVSTSPTLWKKLGLERSLGDRFVTYADDFVILCRRGVDRILATILPEKSTPSPLERAVNEVRDKLAVTSDTRSYLISIGFTAASPESAAKVVNAFAIEYLKAKMMQRRTDAMMTASRQLTQRSAILGEKHPSVARAKAELEAARVSLQAGPDWSDAAERDLVAAEGVSLAEPNATLSSPKGSAILGLTFIAALTGGIGLALWRDRKAALRKAADRKPVPPPS